MLEDVWGWWIVHTDHSASARPKYGPMGVMFQFMQTNFGNNINEQCPRGPNKNLCMENLEKLNTNFNDHCSRLSGLELRDNDNKKFRANDKLTRVQVNY